MSEDMKDELERLRQENAALKKGAAKGVSLKVSEKELWTRDNFCLR